MDEVIDTNKQIFTIINSNASYVP